jgi:hypothetical protein
MKKQLIFTLIITLFLLLISTSVFSADVLVQKDLETFPKGDYNFDYSKDNYLVSAQWNLTNNSDKAIGLYEIDVEHKGATSTSDFWELMLVIDEDQDGEYDPEVDTLFASSEVNDSGITQLDRGIFRVGSEPFMLPIFLGTTEEDKTKTILLVYKLREEISDGEIIWNSLKKLAGLYEDDSSYSETMSFTSSTRTVNKDPIDEYYIKILPDPTKDGASWVLADTQNTLFQAYTKGSAMYTSDFTMRVYEDYTEVTSAEGYNGYANITSQEVVAQRYLTNGTMTNIAVFLRHKESGPSTENLNLIVTKDAIDGEVIYDVTKEVTVGVNSTWVYFDLLEGEAQCGNYIIDEGEECDKENLNQKVCEDFEGKYDYYNEDLLSCNSSCELDTSNCMSLEEYLEESCINGNLLNKEFACDILNEDLDTNYVDGNFIFDGACNVDISACVTELAEEEPIVESVCGNGVRETGENCDGSDFAGDDCSNYGFDKGILQCSADCTVSVGACYNEDEEAEENDDPVVIPTEDEENNEIVDNNLADENITTNTGINTDNNNSDLLIESSNEPIDYLPIIGLILAVIIVVGGAYYLIKIKKIKLFK